MQPATWIVGKSLGPDAGIGGLMDALPAIRDGLKGNVSRFFQQQHIKFGAVLLGPNKVAGVSPSFKESAIAQRIPENGIASDKVERVLKTKPAIRLSAIHREGQIQGIRRFVQANGIGSIIDVIASSGIEPKNQLIAAIGIIEATGDLLTTKNNNDIESLKIFITRVLEQISNKTTIVVAVNSSRINAVQKIVYGQLGINIKLRPIPTVMPQGKMLLLLTQRYMNYVVGNINGRLLFAKNDQTSSLD